MKSRYFWEKANLTKYTIFFETDETVLGRNEKNEFRLFRKDTDLISFSEREVLEIRLAELENEKEIEIDESENLSDVNNFSWRTCFG